MHQEVLEQYPEDVKREAARLADLVSDVAHQYGDQIMLRVIDPQSLPGFFLSIRHWVRRYPTFIIDGRKAYVGADHEGIDRILQDYLRENPVAETMLPRSKPHDRVT